MIKWWAMSLNKVLIALIVICTTLISSSLSKAFAMQDRVFTENAISNPRLLVATIALPATQFFTNSSMVVVVTSQ